MLTLRLPRTSTQWIGFIVGIVGFFVTLFLDTPLHHVAGGKPAFAAAAAFLMAVWWLTEAQHITITALVPIVVFPMIGVFGMGYVSDLLETLLQYLDPYIWLFAGGLCIAAAMQRWGLHQRIALNIMKFIGTDPKNLLLGMLTASSFVSLWLSNTATAALMFPIGMAIIKQLESSVGNRRLGFYGMAIMLSIAYGSNIGLGTTIATAPNAMFVGFMEKNGMPISFLNFMIVGIPFSAFLVPITWYFLWRVARRDILPVLTGKEAIHEELSKLGTIKKQEWSILYVFLVAAVVWIFSEPINSIIKPHITAFTVRSAHIEGSISLLAGISLLLFRREKKRLLSPRDLVGLPWGTLILLGGSFAMAAGIQSSGLSVYLGKQLVFITEMSEFMQVLFVSVAAVIISAIASNTATIAIMLNVLSGVLPPSILPTALFSATMSSSCDFALPAGTPPNAIVFGSGYVTIPQMAKTGAVLDIICGVLSAIWCWFIVRLVL